MSVSCPRYWLTRDAESDLEEIARYTLKTWDARRLEAYRQRLEHRLELLLANPEQGRNHPMLSQDFRYVVEGKHYIFYRRVDREVEVLRFLHCRCDTLSKLAAYL